MARLECQNCKSVFQEVVRVRKCPLCGNREFRDAEPQLPMRGFPKWFTYHGNIGFVYFRSIRSDDRAQV